MRPLAQLVAFIYTGELSDRGKEEILALAGHLQLNVDFSQSKSASAKKPVKEANLESLTIGPGLASMLRQVVNAVAAASIIASGFI